MPRIISNNLKRCLPLSLAVLLLASSLVSVAPVLAAEGDLLNEPPADLTSQTDATTTNNNDQNAESGQAAVEPVPAEVPAVIVEPILNEPEPVLVVEPTLAEPVQDTNNLPVPEQPQQVVEPEIVPAPVCNTDPTLAQSAANQPGGASTDANLDVQSNLAINNNQCAIATSGDATVTGSHNGGNATTGDASSIATLINFLQSTTGLSGAGLATFINNIYGNQYGDIQIDPNLLDYIAACQLCSDDTILKVVESNSINNDIYMSANSGDATVSGSGSGGNAKSGDATVLLNLVNIISSVISGGKSFVGVINIFGNLEGDILLPPDILNGLLNSGPSGGSGSSDLNLTVNNNQSINNNISLNSASGNASVTNNGGDGNAVSGAAKTSLTMLNLTNSQIVGGNVLLVFVNVLGNWLGLILDAPQGTTAASFGGSNNGCVSCAGDLDADITKNSTINNNIVLNATSGNATVEAGRGGGNATSGNASTTLNLVNIINSQFSLSGWLGILFINVFGTWNGSFGVDTQAGDPAPNPTGGSGGAQNGNPTAYTVVAASNNKFVKYNYQSNQVNGDSETKNDTFAAYMNPSNPIAEPASEGGNSFAWKATLASLCCLLALSGTKKLRRDSRELQQV